MQIGKRIYYDLATGNVIVDTGERSGSVVETTVEQDFESYAALAERLPSTVGCLQLEYGDYAQDFAECNGYRVDVSGETPSLLFSYPDPAEPGAPPVYRKPLSEEVSALRTRLAAAEQAAADNSLAQQELLELLIEMGVI